MREQSAENTIPQKFNSVFGDRAVFGMLRFYDAQLHCVISFDGRVDENRLARAVRLSLDAEPILGCRFVRHWRRPYWQRRDDLDQIELLRLVRTELSEQEMLRFMTEPADICEHPLVRCRVFRGDCDTLCIRISHLAADAGGAKEYACILASIYRELSADPDFTPRPNVTGRRSMSQLGEHFSFADKLGIIRRTFRDAAGLRFPRARWAFPAYSAEASQPACVLRHIGPDRFRAMKRLGEKYGATINDIMLAAIFRALYEIIKPNPDVVLRLTNTVDLRRYLPSEKTEALCSFSGFSYPNIGTNHGAAFGDTLVKVRDNMNALKADYIGLGDLPPGMAIFKCLPFRAAVAVFENVWGRMVTTGILPPDFTNMGVIDHERLDFGDSAVEAAFLTAGTTFPPFFGMGLSGFRESLTLSAGFCGDAAQHDLVERFFDLIIRELPAS